MHVKNCLKTVGSLSFKIASTVKSIIPKLSPCTVPHEDSHRAAAQCPSLETVRAHTCTLYGANTGAFGLPSTQTLNKVSYSN